jgi:hypothetical protein
MENKLWMLFFDMIKEMNKISRDFFKTLGLFSGSGKRKKK